MNNFAEIKLVERFNKVNYYSLSINEEPTLFNQFVTKQARSNKEKLNHIMAWLKVIGEKYGAQTQYFRNESETAETGALPPKGKDRVPVYVKVDENGNEYSVPNNLRLYCMRVSDNVVFLFNGDIKTANKAQDCDNVRPHFRQANKLSALIDKAFFDSEIQWNDDHTDILLEDIILLYW